MSTIDIIRFMNRVRCSDEQVTQFEIEQLSDLLARHVDGTGDYEDTPWIDLVDAAGEALYEVNCSEGASPSGIIPATATELIALTVKHVKNGR